MQDATTLDHLLECLHELNWVEAHLPQSSGSLHERLNVVRDEVRSEILSIVNDPGHRNDA
jgi:hypothetical protein